MALAVTAGHAVKAMVLNGLGFVNQQFYLVPHFFRNKPTSRLIAPAIAASHLNDDTLGRALNTLYAYGVTELYSLIAATAAKRLGLAPTFVHLDSASFQGGGRDSRDHRPALNQGMLDRMVEHQAGIPVLMKPLSGHISDAQDFGQVVRDHLEPLHITYGTTYVVADRALSSAENFEKLPILAPSGSPVGRRPCARRRTRWPRPILRPLPRLRRATAIASWPRAMEVCRNDGY